MILIYLFIYIYIYVSLFIFIMDAMSSEAPLCVFARTTMSSQGPASSSVSASASSVPASASLVFENYVEHRMYLEHGHGQPL